MADYKKIIPFILKKEGGLSRSLSDTASNYPSPCSYNGQKGWHTNKGITYQTFSYLAPKLNFSSDCSTFLKMPEDVWGKIFKNGYWNIWKLDFIKSQVVADYIVSFAWASGNAGAKNQLEKFLSQKGINVNSREEIVLSLDKLAKKNEEKLFNELIEFQKNYYRSLNQPSNLTGWINRVNEFKEYEEKYITKRNALRIILIIAIILIMLVAVYLTYKTFIKKHKS
ncbi:MAG: glycosyl hydrolase 108 family protein [Parachlamydiales bacterium]|jgi:lysozyme family protein